MGVRNRLAAALVAACMLLAGATTANASVACPGDEAQPTVATAYDTVMALMCDINEFRARNGLRPLSWDWRLWYGAQNHATDMAARHYLAHVTPEGRGLAERISPTGYIPEGAGWTLSENLGFGTSMLSSPLAIAVGWMNSKVHRDDILDPDVDNVGIGLDFGPIADGGQSGAIYVANFGHREEPIVARVTPHTATPHTATPQRATKIPVRTVRTRKLPRKVQPRVRSGRTGRR